MTRIFTVLAALSTLLLIVALVLGLQIADPKLAEQGDEVRYHLWAALFALLFAAFVHAVVLTYFMGTGRWLEETTHAYRISEHWWSENQTLKYRTILPMVGCLLLLILNVPLGAVADPASPVGWDGWGGLSAARIHFVTAAITVGVNVVVNLMEYFALARNGALIDEVLGEVRRIREERGLPV